jgi:predicted RNA-binding Zn ribbon-like protein
LFLCGYSLLQPLLFPQAGIAMQPLFLGSHLAMDFLNTSLVQNNATVELIGDAQAFVEWLVAAGLVKKAEAVKFQQRFGAEELDAIAAEARKIRAWAGAWLSRWRVNPDVDYAPELRRLNKLMAAASCFHEITSAQDGVVLVERNRFESPVELLALIAQQIAQLIASEQSELVKRCAGPTCVLWFLDRTKAHRRLFCSTALCGNRAKVAAFRERQRDA